MANNDTLTDAILALSEALDPDHQGEQWPDPIAWDGRPLDEQASDLLVLADAEIEQRPEHDVPEGLRTAATDVRRLTTRDPEMIRLHERFDYFHYSRKMSR